MFLYYSSAFGDNTQWSGYPLLETAVTEYTFVIFVCFVQAAGTGAADLFLTAFLTALTEDGCL